MAKGKQARRPDIRADHHVARHCNNQWLDIDPKTQAIRGVFPAAFELRVKINETYLSLNWFEYFQADLPGQYRAIVEALRRKRTVGARTAIARLNSERSLLQELRAA